MRGPCTVLFRNTGIVPHSTHIAAVPILSSSAENRTTAGQLVIGCRSESEHIIGGESCFAHSCSCAQRKKLGQEQLRLLLYTVRSRYKRQLIQLNIYTKVAYMG